MIIDGIDLLEGSQIGNLTIDSGDATEQSALTPTVGEMFYRSDINSLQAYNGSQWEKVITAETSVEVVVGNTTTVDAEAFAASYTPSMSTQHIRTMTVTGAMTINAGTGGGAFSMLMTTDASGPYFVSLGANVVSASSSATSLLASTSYVLEYKVFGTTTYINIVEVS